MSRLRWIALVVAGCAAPPQAVPAPTPALHIDRPPQASPAPSASRYDTVQPAATFLRPTTTARAAKIAFNGPLYATLPASKAAVSLTGSAARQEAFGVNVVDVVEEHPEAIRVLLDGRGVRLVAYVAVADLQPVIRRRTRVVLDATALPEDNGPDGVWLRPGVVTPLRRPGSRPPLIETLALDDFVFAGQASFDPGAVERVYEKDEVAITSPPDSQGPLLAAGTVVTTAAGAPLVTTREDAGVVELAREGGRRRVRYVSEVLWIEGWVPDAAVTVAPRINGLALQGMGEGGGSSWEPRYFHRGDELRAVPGGEVIGVVTGERVYSPVMHDRAADGSAQYWIELAAAYGARLWLTGEAIAYGERWEAVYTSRARLAPMPGAHAPTRLAFMFWENEVYRCWSDALDAGHAGQWDLQLVWQGSHVAVPSPAGLPAPLHACLVAAFADAGGGGANAIRFMLHLEPTPLPER